MKQAVNKRIPNPEQLYTDGEHAYFRYQLAEKNIIRAQDWQKVPSFQGRPTESVKKRIVKFLASDPLVKLYDSELGKDKKSEERGTYRQALRDSLRRYERMLNWHPSVLTTVKYENYERTLGRVYRIIAAHVYDQFLEKNFAPEKCSILLTPLTSVTPPLELPPIKKNKSPRAPRASTVKTQKAPPKPIIRPDDAAIATQSLTGTAPPQSQPDSKADEHDTFQSELFSGLRILAKDSANGVIANSAITTFMRLEQFAKVGSGSFRAHEKIARILSNLDSAIPDPLERDYIRHEFDLSANSGDSLAVQVKKTDALLSAFRESNPDVMTGDQCSKLSDLLLEFKKNLPIGFTDVADIEQQLEDEGFISKTELASIYKKAGEYNTYAPTTKALLMQTGEQLLTTKEKSELDIAVRSLSENSDWGIKTFRQIFNGSPTSAGYVKTLAFLALRKISVAPLLSVPERDRPTVSTFAQDLGNNVFDHMKLKRSPSTLAAILEKNLIFSRKMGEVDRKSLNDHVESIPHTLNRHQKIVINNALGIIESSIPSPDSLTTQKLANNLSLLHQAGIDIIGYSLLASDQIREDHRRRYLYFIDNSTVLLNGGTQGLRNLFSTIVTVGEERRNGNQKNTYGQFFFEVETAVQLLKHGYTITEVFKRDPTQGFYFDLIGTDPDRIECAIEVKQGLHAYHDVDRKDQRGSRIHVFAGVSIPP